jgi:hypothetical protein
MNVEPEVQPKVALHCFSGSGVAGQETGPARGVAQDVPFYPAARLERRAGALTETERSYKNEYDFLARNALPKSKNASLTAHFRQPILGCISAAKTPRVVDNPCIMRTVAQT